MKEKNRVVMEDRLLISIYTQVFNTKESDLRQCIESVLSQTYENFEYFIVDNGSTDSSKEVLREYAARDPRVHLARVEKNDLSNWHYYDICQNMSGEYLTVLDSDDWWEPDYLERLVAFAVQNDLDIACTGSRFHYEAAGTKGERGLPRPLVLDRSQYHLAYPVYHAYFRTYWGKLIHHNIAKKAVDLSMQDILYGLDTVLAFRWLRESRRMGVDSSVLHHYRVHGGSVSYQYDPRRFQSDVYLYNDAMDFLKPYGPISVQNQTFLYQVYANAVLDTMQVIQKSRLSTEEKLHEYAEIAAHPITQMAYRCPEQACQRSRECLLNLVCAEGLKLRGKDEDLRRAFQALLPRCGLAVTGKNLPLFLSRELKERFLQDDRDGVVRALVSLLPGVKNPQQYELGTTAQRLAVEHPLLFQVNDLAFLQSYAELYLLLWDNRNLEALDYMTGQLLEGKVTNGQEVFLNLYINLSALENQIPAFLFGKIQLAQLYLTEKRYADCQDILQELDQMGMKDHEDVLRIKDTLKDMLD